MNRAEALSVLNLYKSDSYYSHGSIPPQKSQVATESYFSDKSDEALALIDTTVFGSAKTGMVIGLKGIYFANDWTTKTDKNFLSWEDLKKCESSIKNGAMGCIFLSQGCEFNMSGSSMKRKTLIDLLKKMILLSDANIVPEIKNELISDSKDIINKSTESGDSNKENTNKNLKESSFGVYVSLFFAIFIINKMTSSEPFLSIIIVMAVSLCYMIYFIISEKLHHEILKSVAISFALIALAAASGILLIPLIIWVLYNISKTIDSVKSLKSSFLFSMLVYILLSLDTALNSLVVTLVVGLVYMSAVVTFSKKMEDIPLKIGLMQLSVMFLSIPLVFIMIGSIFSGVKNIFNVTFGNVTRGVNMPQNVAAHMRGDVAVSAYTRNVSTTVTETVTKHVVGVGAVTIGVTGSVAQSIDQKEDKSNEDVSK